MRHLQFSLPILFIALLAVLVVPISADDGTFTPCSGYSIPDSSDGKTPQLGPWAMRLMIALSDDGLKFERTNTILSDQADVPDAITMPDGEARVYYITWCPDQIRGQIVVASTRDGKDWLYKPITIDGYNRPKSTAVDPTVEFTDDGKIRLYFTSFPEGPGSMQRGQTYSAISEDGYTFNLEDGVRFKIDNGPVLDPTVLKIGDTWHYFAGGTPGSNYHATSQDGLTFTRVEDFKVGFLLMSNGLAMDGGYRYYTFEQKRGEPTTTIYSLFTNDGLTWKQDDGVRLAVDTTSTLETRGVKDAAVTRLADGRYLMIYSTTIADYPIPTPPKKP